MVPIESPTCSATDFSVMIFFGLVFLRRSIDVVSFPARDQFSRVEKSALVTSDCYLGG